MQSKEFYLVVQPIQFMGRETEYEILSRLPGHNSAEALINGVVEAKREFEFDVEVVQKALVETPKDMRIALNLLPKSLEDERLFNAVDDLVASRYRDRRKITLELNEETDGEHMKVFENILKFKSMGYKISLDDFSGKDRDFRLMERVRPDAVKFDRSLVGNSEHGDLVKMLNEKNIDTVLEGVETLEDVRLARLLGYTGIQGYFIGKPQPIQAGDRSGVLMEDLAVSFTYKD